MDKNKAKQIILNNHNADKNSFMYFLHEKNYFSDKLFWEYYDSIVALVMTDKDKTPELTKQITGNYQRILKYFVFHFDPDDSYVLKDFPIKYVEYMERLEYALMAYYSGNIKLISEEIFELQRE